MKPTLELLLRFSLWRPHLNLWLPFPEPPTERCWMGPDGRPAMERTSRCWRPAVFEVGIGAGFPCCGLCRLRSGAKEQPFGKLGASPHARLTERQRMGSSVLSVKALDGFLFEEGLDYWLDWDAMTIALAVGSRIPPGCQISVAWEPLRVNDWDESRLNLNRAARRRLFRARP